MTNPLQSTIDDLEKDYAELERQKNGLLVAINILRAKAGMPPRPEGGRSRSTTSDDQSPDSTVSLSSIKHDTFFGKKMGTAAREFLEMHKAQGQGPAKPREILDALKQGGFVFETKDDGIAMISLRNMLRKNTVMFQRLPNGTYGLRSWYPNVRKPKPQANESDNESQDSKPEAATTRKAAAAS